MSSSAPTLIRDPWRRLWHFFTSDGFLAAVILVCAALLIVAALLPQIPANDLVAYSRWLSEAQDRFGSLFNPLNALNLFSITSSLLFRVTLAALGWCAALRLIDQSDRLRRSEIASRRSHLAAIAAYAGTLVILLGLVLGAFIDYRVDSVVVQPGIVSNIPGTAYAVRLDAVEDQQVKVALLRQTETVVQGTLGDRQPLHDGVTVYLDRIGPALKVAATHGTTQTLDLQNTATSPLQKEVLLLFTPDQNEGFLAAPDVNLVLRVQPSAGDGYTAQIYQSATGKDFGSQPFQSGGRISIEGTTFTFEPAAYVIVSLANQPSHWIIAAGLVIALVGLVGCLIWSATPTVTRFERVTELITRVSWPLITLLLLGLLINVYPRTASLGSGDFLTAAEIGLAAWMLASGSVMTMKRARVALLVSGIVSAALALWFSFAARA